MTVRSHPATEPTKRGPSPNPPPQPDEGNTGLMNTLADRSTRILVPLALAALLLAACSSPKSSTAPPTHSTTTSKGTTTTSGGSSTSVTTTTILPVARTSGALGVYTHIALPIPAGDQVIAAEGPDGAVFATPFLKAAAPSIVWVIDGTAPAAVAEHVTGGVSALAADSTNLYVASETTVTAYSRTTGNEVNQWTLPPFSTANTSDDDLVSMAAFNGTVLVSIPLGNAGGIYRITASSAAAPQLVVQDLSAAFGPDGSIYYERSDDHLVALSASGVSTVGPVLANAPNDLGGGVQEVNAVAGGVVYVTEPAGQGLDAGYTTYIASTLAQIGTSPGVVTNQIADTAAGALVLSSGEVNAACPQVATSPRCVFRISSSGEFSDPTDVGDASLLLGPDPAVVTPNSANTDYELDRLS
jgi:hypothetical protein